jgi:hypothetical protein
LPFTFCLLFEKKYKKAEILKILFALTLRYEILKPWFSFGKLSVTPTGFPWEAGLMFLLEVKTKASLLAQPES